MELRFSDLPIQVEAHDSVFDVIDKDTTLDPPDALKGMQAAMEDHYPPLRDRSMTTSPHIQVTVCPR
jgi:hypothetical protein